MSLIKNGSQLESAIDSKIENNIYFTSSKFFPKFSGEKLNSSFQNGYRNKLNEYSIKRDSLFTAKERFVTKRNSLTNNSFLGIRVVSLDGKQVTKTTDFNNRKFSLVPIVSQAKDSSSSKKSKQPRNIIISRVKNERSISQINRRNTSFETDINKMTCNDISENKLLLIDAYNHNRSFSEVNNTKITVQDVTAWENHNFINYKTTKNEKTLQNSLLKNQKVNENCSHLKSFVNIKFDSEPNQTKSATNQNIMSGKIKPSLAAGVKKCSNKSVKSRDPNFNFNTFAKFETVGLNCNQNQSSLITLLRNDSNQTTIINQNLGNQILNQRDMNTEDLTTNFIDDNQLLFSYAKPKLSAGKFRENLTKNLSFILRAESKGSFLRTKEEIEKKKIENYNSSIISDTLIRAQTSLMERKKHFRKKQIMRSKTPVKKSDSPIRSMMNKLAGFTAFTKIQIEKIKNEIGDGLSNKSDDSTLREYMGKEKKNHKKC